MKSNKSLYIILAVIVVLIVGASFLYKQLGTDDSNFSSLEETTLPPVVTEPAAATEQTQTEPANLAPDCQFYDVDGNAYRLSDFIGKPVILNLWASWCGPCKREMPALNDAYVNYGDQIEFVIVNLTDGTRETVESASQYIAEQGYDFPVYYDTDLDVAKTYRVYGVPVTYLIDANGSLVAQKQGELNETYLQQGIDMILP